MTYDGFSFTMNAIKTGTRALEIKRVCTRFSVLSKRSLVAPISRFVGCKQTKPLTGTIPQYTPYIITTYTYIRW